MQSSWWPRPSFDARIARVSVAGAPILRRKIAVVPSAAETSSTHATERPSGRSRSREGRARGRASRERRRPTDVPAPAPRRVADHSCRGQGDGQSHQAYTHRITIVGNGEYGTQRTRPKSLPIVNLPEPPVRKRPRNGGLRLAFVLLHKGQCATRRCQGESMSCWRRTHKNNRRPSRFSTAGVHPSPTRRSTLRSGKSLRP